MRNTRKTNRPPIPDTWGSENASPTRSHELISDNKSIAHEPRELSNQDELMGSSKDFSPIEEYLRMTERLIKSKSLSPRETDILKNLYAHYESIRSPQDVENTDFEPRKRRSSTRVHDRTGVEVPSTSKGGETTKPKELQEDTRRKLLEAEERMIQLETVEDTNETKFCNPDRFKIDNVFSDFSLDVRYEESSLKQTKEWIRRRKKGPWVSPKESKQSTVHRVEKQPEPFVQSEEGQSTSVSYEDLVFFCIERHLFCVPLPRSSTFRYRIA